MSSVQFCPTSIFTIEAFSTSVIHRVTFFTKLISSHSSIKDMHLKFLVFIEHTQQQLQEIANY
jgi:hypothetical protein